MVRGFKTKCENISLELRKVLNLEQNGPLLTEELAKHLGVHLLIPENIPGLSEESLSTLLTKEKNSWSAVTISSNGTDLLIYNPTHSKARQSSDIMHELAHILLDHDPGRIFFLMGQIPIGLREYDKNQEEEAEWLSGCLLLPRTALISIKNQRISEREACNTYKVSKDLLIYRLNKTGVNRQFSQYR